MKELSNKPFTASCNVKLVRVIHSRFFKKRKTLNEYFYKKRIIGTSKKNTKEIYQQVCENIFNNCQKQLKESSKDLINKLFKSEYSCIVELI
jgi:hypothetical protein